MWHLKLSRRRFLALSGIALASQLTGKGLAQTSISRPMRIGAVLPAETGLGVTGLFPEVRVGEIALFGAVMGEERVSVRAEGPGNQIEVLIASAPDGETAMRAAERLASAEEVFAVIGGIGLEQAVALSQVSKEREIPFFNIGASDDTLRSEACSRYTFHVEASAAMYLDSLMAWLDYAGFRHCYFVQADTAEHEAHYQRALLALKMRASSVGDVSRAVVSPAQPVFLDVFENIRLTDADVVILLLDAAAQLVFLGQYGTTGLEASVTGSPSAATQTRDFYAALRDTAPKAGSGYRVTLWEPTLSAYGAGELNARFQGRWGRPMDSPAWAAYESVRVLNEAVSFSETLDAAKIIDYLENPQTTLDVHKGPGVSFRPWDHQLRQPLYLIKVKSNAKRLLNLAAVVDELPMLSESGTDPLERLDQLGDLRNASSCRL